MLPGPGSEDVVKTEKSGVWFHGRGRLGMEGVVPHGMVGSLWFLVLLLVFVWAGPSCRVAYCTLCSWRLGHERIVPHTVGGPSPLSSCSCSYARGQGAAVGPKTGQQCWPLLAGVWRAFAPLMKRGSANGCEPEPSSVKGVVCSLALR